ncbi:MAG: hypothetical protein IT385_12060 [Deltaproteobacteria bacterium]|nr:hypothetical protein [Deltaproteobacteria bacterium]
MSALTRAPVAPSPSAPSIRFRASTALPSDVHGLAYRSEAGGYLVWMNREKARGLAHNDRESWLTLFHELGHVIFGDCDRDPRDQVEHEAREARAEGFAELMLGAIREALRLSASANAGLAGALRAELLPAGKRVLQVRAPCL